MKRSILLTLWFALLIAGVLIVYIRIERRKEKERSKHILHVDTTLSLSLPLFHIPDTLSFAGERMPLKRPEVKERLEKALYGYALSGTALLLLRKRLSRDLPMLRVALARARLPEDFVYIPLAESGLDIDTPGGLWQLSVPRARAGGLRMDEEVDERYDTQKASAAAGHYLRDAFQQLGTWTAAALAYASDTASLAQAFVAQRVNNVYDLWLADDALDDVYRWVALREILRVLPHEGYALSRAQEYAPLRFRTVHVEESIADVRVFAYEQGSTYEALRRYNPWLRGYSLTLEEGMAYTLRFPRL